MQIKTTMRHHFYTIILAEENVDTAQSQPGVYCMGVMPIKPEVRTG